MSWFKRFKKWLNRPPTPDLYYIWCVFLDHTIRMKRGEPYSEDFIKYLAQFSQCKKPASLTIADKAAWSLITKTKGKVN
jgi:hypothetical protein